MDHSRSYKHVSTSWLRAQLENAADLLLVDVRTVDEFISHHIPQALHHPLDTLPAACRQLDHQAQIVLICEHGIRSEMAARYLAANGFSGVSTMDGGMAEYEGEVIYGE